MNQGTQIETNRLAVIKANTRHGHASRGRVTRAYKAWAGMKTRAGKLKWYFDVTVCKRWMKFENFLADMGEPQDGESLDRIDAAGNYEPKNCRWADSVTQANNKRVPRKHDRKCANCLVRHAIRKGMCHLCSSYLHRTGRMRPPIAGRVTGWKRSK